MQRSPRSLELIPRLSWRQGPPHVSERAGLTPHLPFLSFLSLAGWGETTGTPRKRALLYSSSDPNPSEVHRPSQAVDLVQLDADSTDLAEDVHGTVGREARTHGPPQAPGR